MIDAENEQVAAGMALIQAFSLAEVVRFVASGAMANELGVWMEAPLVEITTGLVVIHERMRIL